MKLTYSWLQVNDPAHWVSKLFWEGGKDGWMEQVFNLVTQGYAPLELCLAHLECHPNRFH